LVGWHARRLAERERGDAGSVDDALAVALRSHGYGEVTSSSLQPM
jgi:hypothetical protein